jgi:hypothetical protein
LHSTAHAIPPIPPPTTITLNGLESLVIVATPIELWAKSGWGAISAL